MKTELNKNEKLSTEQETPPIANVLLGAVKCAEGWHDSSCCCNCKHQIELHRHPMNINFGEGSIMDCCGWVCLNPELTEGKCGIYFDRQHGMCECHVRR